MKTAQITTTWAGDGLSVATAFRPQVAEDYALHAWTDATGQSAAQIQAARLPFTVTVTCDEAMLAQIQADARYTGQVAVVG